MFPLRFAPPASRSFARVLALLLGVLPVACDSDSESSSDSPSKAGPSEETRGAVLEPEPLYALANLTSAGDEQLTYLNWLDNLEPQEVDDSRGREFAGLADIAVHDGALFITEQESVSITKYTLDGRDLESQGSISLADYGFSDIGFWVVVFISPTRAYVVNGTHEYVVWNPASMQIEGTLEMAPFEPKDGLMPFASYVDRSVALVDGLMYHPIYWTDEDYFRYSPTSAIAVYDTRDNRLVEVIEAPCPGLDHVTVGRDGTLYFSSWIYAPGGAAVLDQPATCVAKLEKGAHTATAAFNVRDVTAGGEGGLFRIVGDGKAILSVLDRDHEPEETRSEPASVTYGPNWRFWSYDLASGVAEPIDAIDWNAGAAYSASADKRSYMLIPTGDYEQTQVYDITTPATPEPLFEVRGWALRLLRVR